MKTIIFICTLFSLSAMAQKGITKDKYPQTKMGDQQDVFFGATVKDPYRWLEDDRSEATAEWVKEENKVTDDYLSKISFRNVIKERLTKAWNFEKYSAPFKEGGYTYFYKNDGLQNQFILYRQKENGEPDIFLDPNKFSDDGTTSLAEINFTKDGSLCAYLISEGGSDWRKMIVLNTATKTQVGDTIQNVKFSGISWLRNDGFYYSSYDNPKEGSQLSGKTDKHKLYYHKLNTPQNTDVMVFGGEKTPRRYIGASVTEDQKYLVISAANATYGNELYIKDLSKRDAPIVPIVTGFETEQDVLYSANNKLYILTNKNAPNRKLVVTDAATPTVEHWKDLIAETTFPLTASTGGDKIFAHYIKDAVSRVYQYGLDGKQEKLIELPGLGTAAVFHSKKEENDIYYTYSSYIYPPAIFKYNIAKAKSEIFKKANVQFDASQYESRQVFYNSKDGTRIPMIITHRKGIQLNGNNPTILYGYGGFNISLTPYFSISNLVFMENGGIYAVPNIRGGGEYGDKWHNAGTKLNKQNVFDDFIAAAEFLIKDKITSSQYLAISGGSNGGLLVGASIIQRPELFRVALPAVGVLDMLRYHKFTAGAGWAYDYGTADDNIEMFQYLLKYSPVHNLKANVCYPSTMITTGDHDDRVVPAHSFKFAAALQAVQSCTNPVLIRIETKAGHGAGKPTKMIIEELSDRFAFLFNEMGLTFKAP
ncbi:MAG: S9 family peptidase [Chitinophagaceae bacterium]|nr:S9 family peptidase [Chitinophagaceae bacterium]